LIYEDSDMVVRFITWVRESITTGGGLSHDIATNLYAALILSSRVAMTLPQEVASWSSRLPQNFRPAELSV